MEAIGLPPMQAAYLMYVLVPKPKGGFRGICVFSGLVRLWQFLARPQWDGWIRANDRAFYSCGRMR
eukprot:4162352-Lingulodinium_polyedra.AAC.1